MKTYTVTRTICGMNFKFEVVKTRRGNKTPIFQFICPKCRSLTYEGVVDFDLEDETKCSKCGFEAELWHFPHTVKGSGLYTMGGHYTNDELTILTLNEALDYFLYPWGTNFQRAKFRIVHGGGQPWIIGTLDDCLKHFTHLYGIEAGKIEIIDYAVIMSEVYKELRDMTGAPYILEREAVILDQKHLDQLATRNLIRKGEVASAELWGDKQRAISGVWYEANTQMDDDPPGIICISTGHLLLERYRGTFIEALSKPKSELHEEIIDAATRIAGELTKSLGVPVYLRTEAMMDLLKRDGEIYEAELYEFNSDFSTYKFADARGILDEIIKRAEVLKEAYFRWMTARKSILEKHGIDATALYVRDLLEGIQRLPPWSCLVTPTDEGYIAEVDDDYARIASGELNRQIREIRVRRLGEEVEVELRTDYIPIGRKARQHHMIIDELPERGNEEMATSLITKNLQFINQHAPNLGRILGRMKEMLNETSAKIGPIKCVDSYDPYYTILKLQIKLRQEELAPKLGDILPALISTYKRIDQLVAVPLNQIHTTDFKISCK